MQPHIHCYYSKFQSLKNVRTQFLEQLVGRPAENKLIGQRNYWYGLAKSMFSIEGDGESVVKWECRNNKGNSVIDCANMNKWVVSRLERENPRASAVRWIFVCVRQSWRTRGNSVKKSLYTLIDKPRKLPRLRKSWRKFPTWRWVKKFPFNLWKSSNKSDLART